VDKGVAPFLHQTAEAQPSLGQGRRTDQFQPAGIFHRGQPHGQRLPARRQIRRRGDGEQAGQPQPAAVKIDHDAGQESHTRRQQAGEGRLGQRHTAHGQAVGRRSAARQRQFGARRPRERPARLAHQHPAARRSRMHGQVDHAQAQCVRLGHKGRRHEEAGRGRRRLARIGK
jgi:hypothetical protein